MKGFTLIEVMIVFAIVGILAAILLPIFYNPSELRKDYVCLEGFKFTRYATPIQILNANGGGIPCDG